MRKALLDAIRGALKAMPSGYDKFRLEHEVRRTLYGIVSEEIGMFPEDKVYNGYISVSYCAKHLGVPVSKLHNLHAARKLRYILYDEGYFYPVDVVKDYVKQAYTF